MKTGFPNPMEPKPGKSIKSPWDFECPPYDERSSCYVNAGSHYGVGHKNPIGHEGEPKQRVPSMPFGRPETLKVSEIPKKNEDLNIQI